MFPRLATVDGADLREEGLAQAVARADPAWKAAVHRIIYELPEGWEGIFEEIRLMAEAAGWPAHSSKAWGSICMTAIREGTLEVREPLRMGHMVDLKSHSRKSQVLRRTGLI